MATFTKTVSGLFSDGKRFNRTPVTVRITKDKNGQTLSLSDDNAVMLLIPLEPLKGMLEVSDR